MAYIGLPLLQKRVDDADLRQVISQLADLSALTEFGGAYLDGSATLTFAVADAQETVVNYTASTDRNKAVTVSTANGTLQSTAGAADFVITADISLRRTGIRGTWDVALVGSTAGTIASVTLEPSSNYTQTVQVTASGVTLAASETVKVVVNRADTSLAETVIVSDVNLWMQTAT